MTTPRFSRIHGPPRRFLEQLWSVKAPVLAKRWGLSEKAVEGWRRRERKRKSPLVKQISPRAFRDADEFDCEG